MLPEKSYCKMAESLPDNHVHKIYHDHWYGFPVHDDNELFGRLILEINQAGLSWTTILNKQAHFRTAYDQFNIHTIARYNDEDRNRLLHDPGIIRNRLKINAAIHNAQVIIALQEQQGSFKLWLDSHIGLSLPQWVAVFKKNFKFTGGEIVNEFLMSTGYLPGAHHPECPVYHMLIKAKPAWYKQSVNPKS